MTTLLAPMRETERKRLIRRTVAEGRKQATAAIFKSLDRRYKVLKRELRRANLRKRLTKNLRDTGTLLRKDDGDWVDWINQFGLDVKDSLKPIVFGVYDTEGKYWQNRGQHLDPLDADVIFQRYEARQGRQISDLGAETRDKVLADITDWYNSNKSLPELIDTLGQYFSEDRAAMIAETESQFIVSEVARDAMGQFGIKKFDVDLGIEACEECFAQADTNPHDSGDDMPPYHPRCDCGVMYVMADDG
jgi:hypothetical protein